MGADQKQKERVDIETHQWISGRKNQWMNPASRSLISSRTDFFSCFPLQKWKKKIHHATRQPISARVPFLAVEDMVIRRPLIGYDPGRITFRRKPIRSMQINGCPCPCPKHRSRRIRPIRRMARNVVLRRGQAYISVSVWNILVEKGKLVSIVQETEFSLPCVSVKTNEYFHTVQLLPRKVKFGEISVHLEVWF